MKKVSAIIGALSLAMSVQYIAPVPSFAAPKRVEGAYCHFPVRSGTWVGFFDGGYEETAWNGRDVTRQVTLWRCFRAKADCVAWKYWVQTDYDKGPQVTWCRRK